MSKSKVVDKCREAFEGNRFWIGIFRTDVDFKGELGEFGLYEAVKSGVSAPYLSEFNNKWVIWCKAWQSRQAEMDELQANLDRADEIATRENNRANKLQEDNTSTTILLGKTIVKKEALEASIEESLKLIKAWSDQSYRDDAEQLIVDIEEALRGEHE